MIACRGDRAVERAKSEIRRGLPGLRPPVGCDGRPSSDTAGAALRGRDSSAASHGFEHSSASRRGLTLSGECSGELLEWLVASPLAIFVLCIYMIHGSFVYGDETVARGT